MKELVDATGADTILTSSWKEMWFQENKALQDSFENALDLQLSEYDLKIRDRTYDNGWERGKGIIRWIEEHGPIPWYVILDDEPYDFSDVGIGKHWVRTPWLGPNGGLGRKHVRYILKRFHLFSTDTNIGTCP